MRVYNHLFTVEEIQEDIWEQQLNPLSEVIHKNAYVDESLVQYPIAAEYHMQFERVGYFVVDVDSKVDKKEFVFNLTVGLKDSKPVDANAPSRSRKEEQAKQLADKLVR